MKRRFIVPAALAIVALSASPALAETTFHHAWAVAAKKTAHSPEHKTFCVQHKGNDHYWREGFCNGDIVKYPDYGPLRVPPGYTVCYVRNSVIAGMQARIDLSHGVKPGHHIKGCM